MSYQGISTGTSPNDGTGDTLINGAIKINDNFQEIYDSLGDGLNLSVTILKSVTEELSTSNTSSATISFDTSGGNIVYFSNLTENISLNINDIPTTSFDNKVLTFTAIVNQSSTAYICDTIKLNGVTKTINWQFGEQPDGNVNSIDFINFIGINTVGSGSTTDNYLIVGNVNGDYK